MSASKIEDSLDSVTQRRIISLEEDNKDTTRILNTLTIAVERISVNLQILHEVKEDQEKLSDRVTETERWIDQNRQSIAALSEDRKKVDKLDKEITQNKPIVKAAIFLTGVIVTTAVGLILTFLFTGKAELMH